jgi:hypothetical protein
VPLCGEEIEASKDTGQAILPGRAVPCS